MAAGGREEEAGSAGTTASCRRPWEGPLPFATVVGEGESQRGEEGECWPARLQEPRG